MHAVSGKIVKDKNFYIMILKYMLPVALQQAINMGVNMIDTMMLGQFGEVLLSASSLANSFYNIFTIFCLGIVGGTSILVSHYYGAKDEKHVKEVFSLATLLISIIAVIFSFITYFFPDKVMALYTDDSFVIREGIRYLRITAFIYFIHGVSFVIAQLMRSVGQPRIGLYVSILSFFVNILANWILIFGHLNAPRLEIAGAAIGTLIARLSELIFAFLLIFKIQKGFTIKLRDLFVVPSKLVVRKYLQVGLPALISDALLGFGNTALSMIIGRLGTCVVSANSICQVVDRLFTVIIAGISNASGIIVGHTIGAGHKETAKLQGYTFYLLSVLFGLFSAMLVYLFGPMTMGIYQLTDETILITNELMKVYSFIVFFQCIQSVMTKGVLRGGGDTRFLMIADILFLWIISIPLGILMGIVLKLSAWVVIIALHIDYIIKSLWCIGRLKSGKWIHEVKEKQ